MERRKPPPPEDLALPPPWQDDDLITEAQWRHHRDLLMSACCGDRPTPWWKFERSMQPPRWETRVLYEMGELRGAELEKVLLRWRDDYERANEMNDRTEFWLWKGLPRKLIRQWDRERQAPQKAGLVHIA
jgi:hypothetical protein